jgi:hypothetical protein
MMKTITPGLRIEYQTRPPVYIWHVSTVGQKAIDIWCDYLTAHIPPDPPESPLRILFILSKYITVTPYFHQQSRLLSQKYQAHFYGRCAVVITKDPSQGAVRIFCKRELPGLWPKVAFDTFHEQENALKWVNEDLPPPTES